MTTARRHSPSVAEGEGATPAGTRPHDLLSHPLLLSADEAARTLRISRATLYRLIYARHLRGVHVGRRLLLPRQELEAYVRRLLDEEGDDDPAD